MDLPQTQTLTQQTPGTEEIQPRSTILLKKKSTNTYQAEYRKALDDNGLYPDIDDPQFVSRLLKKSEFADTLSTFDVNDNPCASGPDFEVTPVQRFVANYLHPRTPYMSALLYHGVGVGKTCAAIQTAEAYLDVYPKRKVLIVCPRAIRQGFYTTIFDLSKLQIGKGDEMNTLGGCTGNTYLKLSNCLYEKDPKVIENRIRDVIKRRYSFFGYLEFRNYIRNVLKKVPKTENEAELRAMALQREFNYRLLIIDEAHNLRDVVGSETTEEEEEEDIDTPDKEDTAGGKELTPFLKELVASTDGIKLLLMSATPMFNSVFEIHFLLNLMLMNDKRPEITMDSILNRDGTPAPDAEKVLKPIANAYVSFMRGENPISFPLRLYPEGMDPNNTPVKRLKPELYPSIQLTKDLDIPVDPSGNDQIFMSKLPIVLSSDTAESSYNRILESLTTSKIRTGGASIYNIDSLLQAGNCIFPSMDEGGYDYNNPSAYISVAGFSSVFKEGARGSLTAKDAKWLLQDSFKHHSPKGATILRYLKHGEGVQFVYSRFVKTGALLLALALEANGYMPYGREPLLQNGIQDGLGTQCAKCSLRKTQHKSADSDHKFVVAKYALLTGDPILSPNNSDLISVARSDANKNGELIKVILGSQIAGEGLDLKFIREIHIFDAWFHLNKTEQIIGRGIRYCSHSLLDANKRNTTVFLHAVEFTDADIETADLFCYRNALNKAIKVGAISQLLKRFAVDCNLRKNVTILRGLGQKIHIDSQGQERTGRSGELLEGTKRGEGVSLDDMDYTAICDWTECKPIKCDPTESIDITVSDDSTYDTFSARYRESVIQRAIRLLFREQPWKHQSDLINELLQRGIPRAAIDITLQGITNNRLFRVKSGSLEGFITYKNKYFLFQPEVYKDLKIPMALRIAPFPIKQDQYSPQEMKNCKSSVAAAVVPEEGVNTTVNAAKTKEAFSIEKFWNVLSQWVSDVATGKLETVGIPLERQLELYKSDARVQKQVYLDIFEIIVLVNKLIHDKDVFQKIVLEYLWDEFIWDDETDFNLQIKFLLQKKLGVADEQYLQAGSIKAIRQVNPNTNELQYFCDDGELCDPGIVEGLGDLEDDPVRGRTADIRTTGDLYGFIVPKRGIMVFKTQAPHLANEKPEKGQECSIVQKNHSMKKLVELRTGLDKVGFKGLDLSPEALKALEVSSITNTVRGCTFLNLILRYVDAIRAGKKRWFFRPIAAYITGHRGIKKAGIQEVEKAKKRGAKPKEKPIVEVTVAEPKKRGRKAKVEVEETKEVKPPKESKIKVPKETKERKKKTAKEQPPEEVQQPQTEETFDLGNVQQPQSEETFEFTELGNVQIPATNQQQEESFETRNVQIPSTNQQQEETFEFTELGNVQIPSGNVQIPSEPMNQILPTLNTTKAETKEKKAKRVPRSKRGALAVDIERNEEVL
jgi:hypothetical protein